MSSHQSGDENWSDCEPEYELETFTIQDYNFHLLTVVPPPLEYMSRLHSNQQEISGRQVWCGSVLLCKYMLTNPSIVRDKRILELGSGTGIVGMLASKLVSDSAKCVCLTDGDTVAVGLLMQNLSNLDNRVDRSICNGRHLLWGCGTEEEKQRNASFEQWCKEKWPNLPWNSDEEGDDVKFDLILAGDVLYKPFLPTLFFSTVNRYLSRDGELYLCHIPRNHVYHKLVVDAATQAGFSVEKLQVDIKELPDGCPLPDAETAVIYRIRRNT